MATAPKPADPAPAPEPEKIPVQYPDPVTGPKDRE